MKKRVLLTILCAMLSIAMLGCGKKDTTEPILEEPKAEENVSNDTEEEQKDDTSDSDAKIEVVDGYTHSDEYNAAFEAGISIGNSYRKTGAAEVSEFDSWQEGYKAIIEDLSTNENAKYALIFVDDDNIPELVYSTDENNIVLATFGQNTVNIFSSQLNKVSYVEGQNVLFASEHVQANLDDYVVAIKDGSWIAIASGIRAPEDPWAEDSFDENGMPIVSYWEVNDLQLTSQEEYDELMVKYYDSSAAKEVKDFKTSKEVLSVIDSL